MANIIQFRRDTIENWELYNPVLKNGEPGFVLEENQASAAKYKIGNGIDTWINLPYIPAGLPQVLLPDCFLVSTGVNTWEARSVDDFIELIKTSINAGDIYGGYPDTNYDGINTYGGTP